jgi:hypothetical protein
MHLIVFANPLENDFATSVTVDTGGEFLGHTIW